MAQAKIKIEIKAIPQQNQLSIIKARQRILRETMHQVRAATSPTAVLSPYEGRAIPLVEKFSTYSDNAQPPKSLAHQIQQIAGLNKCVSVV